MNVYSPYPLCKSRYGILWITWLILYCFLWASPVLAGSAVELELTQHQRTFPIVLDIDDPSVGSVIQKDLDRTGLFHCFSSPSPSSNTPPSFQTVQSMGAQAALWVRQQRGSDPKWIEFKWTWVGQNGTQEGSCKASSNAIDRVAHPLADVIYEKAIGKKGSFSTRIAYILRHQDRYDLRIADADGRYSTAILSSNEPIFSPKWSRDGKKIAYVSLENRKAEIYVSDLSTGARKKITHFSGINSAPAWSPDDQTLAIVLSKSGTPKIYCIHLASGALTQLTQGLGTDTEPSWSSDGSSMLFTSDRGGTPQIYQLHMRTGQIHRLTFEGSYNSTPSWLAGRQAISLLHRGENGYNVAVMELESHKALVSLTQTGRADSPRPCANGTMILYGTEMGELAMVSVLTQKTTTLPKPEGKVQGVDWA